MWVMTGILERFPSSRWCSSSPASAGSAWWVYIADDLASRQGYDFPDLKELPSYYFHRNVHATFIDEPDALQSELIRNRIGVENIMWSSDYPHPVTSWPHSRKIVDELFAGIPDARARADGERQRQAGLEPLAVRDRSARGSLRSTESRGGTSRRDGVTPPRTLRGRRARAPRSPRTNARCRRA